MTATASPPWRGHASTLAGFGRGRLTSAAETVEWTPVPVRSPYGEVELQAIHHDVPGAGELAIFVHGLGGSARSQYHVAAARALTGAGMAVLRVSQRGADRSGVDLHHAGLWEDIAAVVHQWVPARYERVYLVGFSMGGHVALHVGCHDVERLRAVAAVCAPLHLAPAVDHIDHDAFGLYRNYLLTGLRRFYRSYAEHHGIPVDGRVLRELRTIRQWDARAIVPRFGFGTTEAYYERQSVGPRLGELRVPAHVFYTEHDPLVSLVSLAPTARTAAGVADELRRTGVDVSWLRRGGHVVFARRYQPMGAPPSERSFYAHLTAWLRSS